jgi:gamma-glutamylcyclotransferase
MSGDSIITFAYGSNMPTARISAPTRCPSAKALGVAELRGHELRWHKKSNDGSAKADIVESEVGGASVFGVLYEISLLDKPSLDREEGLGNGYDEVRITVLHNGAKTTVTAYKATNIDAKLQPYTWYKALAAFGAKEHGLPAAYVEQIEAVPATEDPSRARHDKNMRLITGGHA